MNNILILTLHNITNSYSCLFYLANALGENAENNVSVWGFGDKSKIAEKYKQYFQPFDECWFGKIRRFRLYCAKIKVYKMLIHFKGVVVINDLDYYYVAYLAHKVNPSFKVVHYNTEMPGKDFHYSKRIEQFYSAHVDFPDVIVECNSGRAKNRKKKYGISKDVLVVDNTVPSEDISKIKDSSEALECTRFSNKNPILIYAGGCDANRALDGLVDAMRYFDNRLNFLFFCYGQKSSMEKLRSTCAGYIRSGYCKIYDAVPREKLLAVMRHCDYGINYYDPNYSASYKYAAPSKFYEYLGTGLKILSTNNEGINHIINDNKVGVCINEEDTISSALDRLLKTVHVSRDEVIETFNKKYSYEIESQELLKQIYKISQELG